MYGDPACEAGAHRVDKLLNLGSGKLNLFENKNTLIKLSIGVVSVLVYITESKNIRSLELYIIFKIVGRYNINVACIKI